MEIKPGYKRTEIGVIPEDWEIKSIGEFSDVITGRTPPTNEKSYYGIEYLFVGPGDIGTKKYLSSSAKMLSERGFNRANPVPANSILVTCIGSTIGKAAVADKILTTNQQVNSILPNKDYDTDFLYYYLLNNRTALRASASEQAVPIINKTTFLSIKVLFPKKDVQQKISEQLNDIDLLMASLEKLIEKKKLIKQGVMQELLTGKKRLPGFTGEWETKIIGACFSILRGSGLSKSQLHSTGQYKCILYGELFTTYTDIIDKVHSATNVCEGVESISGDILLPGSTTTTGIDLAKSSALKIGGVLLGGDINILRPIEKLDSAFISLYINVNKRYSIATKTKGTTIHHLHANDLRDIIIEMPSLEEQIAISMLIMELDKEIAFLEKRLSKYRSIKQAMMQELLTGRIRLL
ncbi:MAG: restriction endonuclease subunit S [Candidatus Cloacimonetes bacterium]|nr:restriction endonuclease subunit S [Candidatus Cloacimonadota bacterium]